MRSKFHSCERCVGNGTELSGLTAHVDCRDVNKNYTVMLQMV